MTKQDLYRLKYPIGEFQKPNNITPKHIKEWIISIEDFSDQIHSLTDKLSEVQLKYKYRPEGWCIKQVVHHCADSHMNSLMRFKLALTEDTPIIRPYFEDRFAQLIDYTNPIDSSISVLNGVHKKLGQLLKSLTKKDLKRQFIHPEHGKLFSIEETIGIYAWHGNHHIAHIEQALKFKEEFN